MTTHSPRELASDAGFHSSEAPEFAFELSSEEKDVPQSRKNPKKHKLTQLLKDTICATAHAYKLLCPSMQMTWLEQQVHHKARNKIILVSFPEYLLPYTGAN